ncbi:MAG: DUF4177 domain-containing protein [Shimia sp.]|uniref:DUF4177 domain-containing protein n=1 Tax=Shimia sp. TaxID=1954381 RepID=UPI001B01080A|nr:DUF4177 domain-containing protein [Shimia sp.]MBO6897785.1 DUF4177 domain-containing protein [Shimia sp.]
MTYEYKVIPAPTRGQKAKGIKAPEGRFANALEIEMNRLGAEGWEYLRADTLPHEERSGLTGSSTSYRSVLVFRRTKAEDVTAFQPETLAAPQVAELPAPAAPIADPEEQNAPADSVPSEPAQTLADGDKKEKDLKEGEPAADVNIALKKRVETLDQSK